MCDVFPPLYPYWVGGEYPEQHTLARPNYVKNLYFESLYLQNPPYLDILIAFECDGGVE